MRPNNRVCILEAAVRVAERDGARRLTLEATAEEAGLTRGGMMYHFDDRDALALAMQQRLVGQWEDRLVAAAGKSADEATALERTAAYATVAMDSATRAELELILETGHDPVMHEAWLAVQRRWTPRVAEAAANPDALRLFVLRLAGDGLWSFDSLGSEPLPLNLRAQLADQIAQLADPRP